MTMDVSRTYQRQVLDNVGIAIALYNIVRISVGTFYNHGKNASIEGRLSSVDTSFRLETMTLRSSKIL